MGLEPYEGRYTLQLQDWTERVFKKRGIDYKVVPGTTIDDSKAIVTGQVLDAHGRSYFGMSQMMNLVQMMKAGEITSDDAIFFEDMFLHKQKLLFCHGRSEDAKNLFSAIFNRTDLKISLYG